MTEAQIKSRALQLSFLLIVKDFELARQCAIIAVDEIIESMEVFGYSDTFYDNQESGRMLSTEEIPVEKFWKEVRAEIEKL